MFVKLLDNLKFDYPFYVTNDIVCILKTDLALDLGFKPFELVHPDLSSKLKKGLQNNFIRVNVYFESLEVRTITQKAKYNVSLYIYLKKIYC